MPFPGIKKQIYICLLFQNQCEPARKTMYAYASQSKNERILWHISILAAKVLDFLLVLIAEVIKAQTVLFCIHNGTEYGLQLAALGRIQ